MTSRLGIAPRVMARGEPSARSPQNLVTCSATWKLDSGVSLTRLPETRRG